VYVSYTTKIVSLVAQPDSKSELVENKLEETGNRHSDPEDNQRVVCMLHHLEWSIVVEGEHNILLHRSLQEIAH
jgi:hypothetical protein